MILEAIVSYLIGSINFAYIIGKLKGIDLSKHWDRNLGATNLYLALKGKIKYPFLYTFLAGLLDVSKGVIPALLFDPVTSSFAILGHNFSIISYIFTKRFPTGCGLATSIGWALIYAPHIFLIAIPLSFLYSLFIVKKISKKLREEMLIHLVLLYSILFYLVLFNPAKEIEYGLLLIAAFTGLARVIRYKELLTQVIWRSS